MWTEIQQVQEHQRHELVLTGTEIAQRIAENGLDEHLYNLVTLNFLEISKTPLTTLDNRIGQLKNLTRLVLHYNKLKELPDTLAQLTKLKFLDVSHNELTELPEVFTTLTELHSINASVNQITKIADLSKCVHLTYVDLSHNKLEDFPENICRPNLVNMLDIKLNSNELKNISPDIVLLTALKQMDLSGNKITVIPKELSECPKLKEWIQNSWFKFGCLERSIPPVYLLHLVNLVSLEDHYDITGQVLLHDNPIKDSRLNKLTTQKPPKFKAMLDYIRDHCAALKLSTSEATSKSKGGSAGKGKGKKKDGAGDDEVEIIKDEIVILQGTDDSKRVVCKPSIAQVRPYIVCCIIRNLQLDVPAKFKKFISIQTDLHDDLCDKRMAATIATHDLELIEGDIIYEARPPRAIKLQPLKRPTDVTAEALVNQLRDEAEALRKEKKRSTFSGIHKYLNLLQDKAVYPCLVSGNGTVISFPPITNSEKSKISSTTKNVLVEVTSSKNLAVCKTVLDKLLLDCLKEGLVSSGDEETSSGEKKSDVDEVSSGETDQQTTSGKPSQPSSAKTLVVEQVRIFDESGELRVVYPSRVDLSVSHINVTRPS